ncbi:MAG: cache domain-containing protein [Desulforhopalus sp.]
MRILKRLTLSSAPFYASLVVVTSLALFIGVFWAINEYQAYRESIENIRHTYKHQYETRLQEELTKVAKLIDYRRQQNEQRVEVDIRTRVQSAYTVASHHYRLYKNEKSTEELRSMIIELLRPIRWNNGRGYYFTGRVEGKTIDLFADEPYFEGKTASEFQQVAGRDVIGDIIEIIKDKEAGLYSYHLIKPQFPGKVFPKIVFVKYFPPLDWFIGAGIYIDDLEENLQHEVLDRIRNIQFGKSGELFCFREDGTILSERDQRLIGRSVRDLVDNEGLQYGERFLKSAEMPEGGFVHFSDRNDATGTYNQKLSFIQSYRDWGWILGAAMFMDAMEHTIAGETVTYQKISFRNVFAFILLFAIAVAFLLLSTFFYSLKIRQEISLFINFFREAADSNVKISRENLMFREFEDLAGLANQMVDERIKSELLLHRDELRLDTLLRLGMMDKHSLQEKYDFVLRRIVRITRSEEGYLALVNDNQTHVSICSYIVFDDKDIALRQGELAAPRPLVRSGLPGKAVRKKSAVIINRFDAASRTSEYPYKIALRRHLDVPIYNDGRIVAIAGVCNNIDKYDNSDIRQMTMLLEGMLMHVL